VQIARAIIHAAVKLEKLHGPAINEFDNRQTPLSKTRNPEPLTRNPMKAA
jgi:hypothetical protein